MSRPSPQLCVSPQGAILTTMLATRNFSGENTSSRKAQNDSPAATCPSHPLSPSPVPLAPQGQHCRVRRPAHTPALRVGPVSPPDTRVCIACRSCVSVQVLAGSCVACCCPESSDHCMWGR